MNQHLQAARGVSPRECELRHEAVASYLANDKHAIERLTETSNELTLLMSKMTMLQEESHKRLAALEEWRRSVESKPRKRWEEMVSAVIRTMASAGAGALIALVIKG